MTIFITHGYCFQTREDSWELLDTLKHKYSCIMTIASKALHKSKQNLGSGWYNIEHWLQEFSITFRLRLFQIFKSCAVHVTRTSGPVLVLYALFIVHFTRPIEDLSFFFEIKQRLKCKTYSIDKEETGIIILKSFSYKVISTDMLVYIII